MGVSRVVHQKHAARTRLARRRTNTRLSGSTTAAATATKKASFAVELASLRPPKDSKVEPARAAAATNQQLPVEVGRRAPKLVLVRVATDALGERGRSCVGQVGPVLSRARRNPNLRLWSTMQLREPSWKAEAGEQANERTDARRWKAQQSADPTGRTEQKHWSRRQRASQSRLAEFGAPNWTRRPVGHKARRRSSRH